MLKKTGRRFFTLFKNAVNLFLQHNGMKLSAALSFYTVFSLSPLLIIVIAIAGVFVGKQAAEGKVYQQIGALIGDQETQGVEQIVRNIQQVHRGPLGSILAIVVLIFGASAVFSEIQESINVIWQVPVTKQKGWLHILIQKLLSFSLLMGISFILIVSLIVNAAVDFMSDELKARFPGHAVNLFYVVNLILILFILTLLFAIIFRVLLNAVIPWKDAIVGAIFTALLFLIGKFLIGFYIGNSHVGLTYGAAASIVIIMMWVYYSSIILYFGAAFTKVYSSRPKPRGRPKLRKIPSR
jgi:membrane protein